MLKSFGKGETLNFASVFYSSEDYQEFNMAKSKVIVLKIARNW